jgi:predicted TIM-barrel fold metal-dependent hydrolase
MDKSPKLELPFPAVDDKEGDFVPLGMQGIIDSHVHVFPEPVFKALWEWFEKFAWPIRYKGTTSELLEYLLKRGIDHIIALQYAHKPGIARDLNKYMLGLCREFPGRITGLATVFPGESEAARILEDAFTAGLGGVKLHAHVQCFDMNSADMEPVYEVCSRRGKPLVMHVGREPKSEAYMCDPYILCRAEKLEQVLKSYPELKICVPHLGMDEYTAYQRMIETYDNLWLDTSVACADFLPIEEVIQFDKMRMDRIMYGSDFPNIPYAWDREIKQIRKAQLSRTFLKRIFTDNAREFFNIRDTKPKDEARQL